MKKNKKLLLLLICVLSSIFVLTACGDKKEKASFEYDEDTLVSCVSDNTTTVGGLSEEELDKMIKQYEGKEESAVLKAGLEQWKTAVEDAGGYVDLVKDDAGKMKYKISTEKDVVYVTAKVKCDKRDVDIKYGFGMVDGSINITSIAYQAKFTMKETMEKAALNTVIGISTVILVLAFLSVFIGLFKYVGKLQTVFENKKNKKNNKSTVVEQIQSKEEIEEKIDDTELIAVITAAISAIEQKSSNGFVVRSIKRAPKNKWNRTF